jgi:DNA-binding NtrC family response regulator
MRVLVVDDERKMGVLLKGTLEEDGHEVTALERSREAWDRLAREPVDLLVTDLKMAPPDGLALLERAREVRPQAAVILMTAYASAQTAVAAMKAGAYDYLVKPFELEELRLRVQKLERERRLGEDVRVLRHENALLRQETGRGASFGKLLGRSAVMRNVFEMAEKVAATDATVLIRGESGTGKGLIARAIHERSPRAAGPFMAVNCGALPENLLESELFGHEKGAFTGAVSRKPGRFVTADTGTIFLDEIGEVPVSLQVKLLQVLEERQFHPVGSDRPVTVDVRVIAATNRDLERAIEEGDFREDLFYRLNVFPLSVPPLRARREDVPLLLDHFLTRLGRSPEDLDADARGAILSHPLPGNVRELENLVERAAILAGKGPIRPEHVPVASSPAAAASGGPCLVPEIPDEGLSLESLEKELILRALDKARGNKSQAARLLGLTRRTLYSRLERHGLAPRGDADDA